MFCPLQFSLSCLALHHQTRQLLPENLQGTLQHSNKEANHVCNFDFSPVKMKMMQTCILAKCFSSAACSTARFLPTRSSAVSGPLTSLTTSSAAPSSPTRRHSTRGAGDPPLVEQVRSSNDILLMEKQFEIGIDFNISISDHGDKIYNWTNGMNHLVKDGKYNIKSLGRYKIPDNHKCQINFHILNLYCTIFKFQTH